MLTYFGRSLSAFLVVLMIGLLSAAAAEKATTEQIAQWIQQLGDNQFAVRERASKQLWKAGAVAEKAVQEAMKSDDAEVVRRARDIFKKFKWGIYPDTPADIVALVRAYQSADDDNGRQKILSQLLRSGLPEGLPTGLKIIGNEMKDNSSGAVERRRTAANALSAALPRIMELGDYRRFETLLEIGHDAEIITHNQYAAYWLLRGKLDERIAHFRTLSAKQADEKRYAVTLTYLYRAKGDLASARKTAEKAQLNNLLDGILYELADWKTLAARPAPENENDVENWAFRAAYTRLAGQRKEFDEAVGVLKKFAASLKKQPGQANNEGAIFVTAKALLLNDQTADGLAALRTLSGRDAMRFEILYAQMKYREAMKIVEEPRPPLSPEQKQLEILKARTLYLLGEKDEAEKLFADLAGHIKDVFPTTWIESLLETEYNIGLKDLAFKHCAQVLGRPPKDYGSGSKYKKYLGKVFPKRAETAEVWWKVLRFKHAEETPAATMKRLRDLMEGKTAAKKIKTWIEEVEKFDLSAANAEKRRLAWANVAAKAGLEDLASSLLEKADTPEALLRLGDLLADKKRWAKAAKCYRRSWDANHRPDGPRLDAEHPEALPLFLAGDALVKAGQEKEGRKLIERAHWLPLGDAAARYALLRGLLERHHTDAVRREAELLLRISDPNSLQSSAAQRFLGITAKSRKDYLKAADGFEQSMLLCLNSGIIFLRSSAYVTEPAQIHRLRAKGLFAAGKFDDMHKHIDLALTSFPGSINVPIALVPEMERRGQKKEASALFERAFDMHDKLCRDYPRCAWAHNSTAWLCACCRRHLDQALQHAQKAVALAPDNAGYLDTLAEVHFQRGEKDKAVELGKRVVKLDPKKLYFRKQLKRLQAGDPSAERPPENDD